MKRTALLVLSLMSIGLTSDIEDIKNTMMMGYLENMENIEAIHKENVDILRQNSIYYINIVRSAQKYYRGFVAKEWGEDNIRLSSNSSFTQYSDDSKARETIDFENGKVILEVVTETDIEPSVVQFTKKLDELKMETPQQALKRDPVAVLSTKYMKKMKIIDTGVKEEPRKEALLQGLVDKQEIRVEQIKQKVVTLKDGKKKKIISVEIPMVPDHLEKRAKRYKEDVIKVAKEYHVDPSYVFGTMQTESYFNPLAVSHVPAYGLMQIVPTTAGIDAYEALYSKKRVLPPVYLYDPSNNIKIGTKYIQIIRERYLKGVSDAESLVHCTAVAYNAGIGSLFRSFTGSKQARKAAIAKINSMSPAEVYKHLNTSPRLTKEARDYVERVGKYRKNYESWDDL